MRRESQVIVARCSTTNKPFGIRIEKINGTWFRTWAFPLTESEIKHENYSDKLIISGSFPETQDFNGCPYCGNHSFTKCGNCEKIGCSSDETDYYTCPWCESSGEVEYAEYFDLKGGGM